MSFIISSCCIGNISGLEVSNSHAAYHSSRKGCLIRPLSLWSDPRQMPPLPSLPICQRRVLCHTVIPHHNRVFLPLHTHMKVGAIGKMIVQELQDSIRLFLLESDDIAGDCCFASASFFPSTVAVKKEKCSKRAATYTVGSHRSPFRQ